MRSDATRIFAMLKVEEENAIPPDQIRALYEQIKTKFDQVAR